LVNQLVLENLKHRPLRTLLSTLAIGIAVMLVLTIVGLSEGMLEDSARRANGVGADIWLRPREVTISASSASMPEKLIEFIEKMDHVRLATGTVVHPLQFPQSVQGVDFEKLSRMSGGIKFISGGLFQKPDDIVVDEYYAEERKLKVGSKINIMNSDWRISGIIESGKLSRLFLPLPLLQEKTATAGKLAQIFIKLDDPKNVGRVMAVLKEKFPDYRANTNAEITSVFSANSIPAVRIFIRVVIGLAVFIGFVFVFLSMYTAVLERTREVGILKALGATPGYIVSILIREAVLLGVAGTFVGIGMSFATRWIFMTFIPASMQQKIVPDWWPTAALIALGGAVLGTIYPGLKAAKQDAIEALAYD
jgi:putative ABC transport system permease protein